MADNELDKLALKYGTDKSSAENCHNYVQLYDFLFKNKRSEIKNFMEIGVEAGNSIRCWQDYFPNATIWGIDNLDSLRKRFTDEGLDEQGMNQKINDTLKDLVESERVELLICDQTDEKFINDALKNTKLNVCLDDGGHATFLHQKSFRFLFPKLVSGGYYVVEDLAYQVSDREDILSFTSTWLQGIHDGHFFSYYIPQEEGDALIEQIDFVSVIGELGIIRKK